MWDECCTLFVDYLTYYKMFFNALFTEMQQQYNYLRVTSINHFQMGFIGNG